MPSGAGEASDSGLSAPEGEKELRILLENAKRVAKEQYSKLQDQDGQQSASAWLRAIYAGRVR